ncbi:hypothetical protein FHS85_001907 [Rhodoligotrophos appendicifer]|uniref:hypothetical protein n=1 Tax=Rhodoligotrophos appendicifer TaxID=987056 RepID=UPI0011850C98|nr:hypothetical protein [Rhodoligotrophos appendicifer]
MSNVLVLPMIRARLGAKRVPVEPCRITIFPGVRIEREEAAEMTAVARSTRADRPQEGDGRA